MDSRMSSDKQIHSRGNENHLRKAWCLWQKIFVGSSGISRLIADLAQLLQSVRIWALDKFAPVLEKELV